MRLIKQVLLWLFILGITSAYAQAPTPAVAPPPDPKNILNLALSTGGVVSIALRPDRAPKHVERVKMLARAGFYDGVIFHRVIEGFMAQTGDPKGTGEGGSPLPDIKAEFNDLPHLRGSVSMARASSNDSANSQFFLMFLPNLTLDGKYTVFGRIISGMQFVDAVERGEPPATPSKIVRAWIAGDGPNAPVVPLVIPPAVPAAAAAAPPAEATPAPAPDKKRKRKRDAR
ncbi:MAG: peptidylprolyl isomerase [Sphingomonadaceae bacterium]